MVHFSAQVGKLQPKTGGSGGSSSGPEMSTVLDAVDKTVFAAVRSITHKSSRRLFFHHNQAIVIGRSLAAKGISPYLDLFMRIMRRGWRLDAGGDKKRRMFLSTNWIWKRSHAEPFPLLNNQSANSETYGIRLLDFTTPVDKTTPGCDTMQGHP
jgi:spore germination protein KC